MIENGVCERRSALGVLRRMLDLVDAPCPSDAVRIDRLAAIEAASSAVAALAVVEAVAVADAQIAEQERLGVPTRIRGRGIADQIGLATRRSPAAASRRLADARVLATQMPATLTALAAGRVSEFGAAIALGETACLSAADRVRVDAELVPVVAALSVRQVEHAVRRRVIELDQAWSRTRTAPRSCWAVSTSSHDPRLFSGTERFFRPGTRRTDQLVAAGTDRRPSCSAGPFAEPARRLR